MKPIDVLQDTKAFVEMVKLQEIEPNLPQVSIFFPDALLIEEKDYKDPRFGRGMYAITQTEPMRVAKIISMHVRNYNILGYNLLELNPTPEGKLAGMFILSVAFKDAGDGIFDEVPSPEFFHNIQSEILKIGERNQQKPNIESVERALSKITIPKGVKEGFEPFLSPLYYFDKYKQVLTGRENEQEKRDLILHFLLHLNLIFSGFLILSMKEKQKSRKPKSTPKETVPEVKQITTHSPVGTVTNITVREGSRNS